MPRLAPVDEFDNPERIRQLVGGIINSDPQSAEKLVILLRLITNPERSRVVNDRAVSDAINAAFTMTCAYDEALERFVREPLAA
jgi:hypothetical protein